MTSWFDLSDKLPGAKGNILYLLNSSQENILVRTLKSEGFHLLNIDGKQISGSESLFREFARSLSFPDYFGHNWDGFIDCLGDLSRNPEKRVAIVWENADFLLGQNLRVFLEATYWLRTIASDLSTARNGISDQMQVLVLLLMEDDLLLKKSSE